MQYVIETMPMHAEGRNACLHSPVRQPDQGRQDPTPIHHNEGHL